ncbi:PREDICTED: uncharacterized protein C1orf64 homolog [Propithecus coquereli]|uniref:Steroid receptor associated and regulated protein n=1 Tax=Propithecus coquereli TaxID=379532 RepID=A0A2K6GE18_PROCO|nr:PREDICTED: uncharacterized protein C1orf64 homolog [Propithecus coquereli]
MAPSENPRDWTASLKGTSLETDLGTSSGGKPAGRPKTVPTAHLTFVIDCARGKPLSLATPVPPRASSPHQGPVAPPMKTYIVFCGENRRPLTQEATLGGLRLAQARATQPPCGGIAAPAPSLESPQKVPEAKGGPLKAAPVRSSTWGTVKDSLRALSSCVCGQVD